MIMLFFMLMFIILGFFIHPSFYSITGILFVIDLYIYFIYYTQQTDWKYCIKLKFKDFLNFKNISPDNWYYGYYKTNSYTEDNFLSVWYVIPTYFDEKNKKIIQEKIFHPVFSYFDWKKFHIWNSYKSHISNKKQEKQATIEFLQACQRDVDKKYKEATALLEKGTNQMKEAIKHE